MKKLALGMMLGLFCLSATAQRIDEFKAETSYLTYPRIPVKDIDWNQIKAEVAHTDISLGDKTVHKGANLCKAKGASIKDAKVIENYYYEVKHQTPSGILRITDNTGMVLFSKRTSEAGNSSTMFGKDDCYFLEAILVDVWKKQADTYKEIVAEDEFANVQAKAQDFVDKAVMFRYVDEEVEVFYPKTSKEHNYDALQAVAQEAAEAYKLINADYQHAEAKAKLETAIAAWEKELEQTDLNDRKSRINKKVAATLRANMALAYAYLQQYNDAIVQVNKALNMYSGMSNNRTMKWEVLRDRCNEQNGYYLLNKDTKVDLSARQVEVTNRGMAAYEEFKNDYSAYASKQQMNEYAAAKDAHDKAVESGELNPYESMVTHTSTQGYMLMYMSFNKLGEFPVEVCELTQLNQIYFKNQDIESIPIEIGQLVNLKRLDLSKNRIKLIPDEIGACKELKTIILKGNPLPQSELDKLTKLLPDCKVKM
ncbi:leucine-rich repeat domain-containing protein [Carboxylicivirga mesophila]|uniref:Leucine-rich repeat domain-containing protein n=1 Tax=Carboxylicivirga mesophila TaxID=1166478 RepID=A0ABS5KFB5_9BACT|nr:leucine-rich repeat domain-containing protein [Carboxylicivirga mesophila]MBS2213671.1 leucine-rich repeat domain-containing protein [Carboxylicivirga mesophila]